MHSIVCVRVHVVFATAERRALIPDELRDRLWPFIGGIAKRIGVKALAVGGTRDHVHVLLSLPADRCLAEVVQKIKANSSRWISEEAEVRHFAWQKGYGAFSVNASGVNATIDYILSQERHHQRRDFAQEWSDFLRKHGTAALLSDPTPE